MSNRSIRSSSKSNTNNTKQEKTMTRRSRKTKTVPDPAKITNPTVNPAEVTVIRPNPVLAAKLWPLVVTVERQGKETKVFTICYVPEQRSKEMAGILASGFVRGLSAAYKSLKVFGFKITYKWGDPVYVRRVADPSAS